MRPAKGKTLGGAIAAACVSVALAACASTTPSAVVQSRASSARGSASVAAVGQTTSAAGETLRQRAEADAAAILRSFAVPPGGHRLAAPPDLPGGMLKTPLSYLVSAWEVHLTDFWQAPGTPQALLAWEQAHLPFRFTLGDADFGPPAWDRAFALAPEGALITRELTVEAASSGAGQTGIRLDAWVAWQPPRSSGGVIPAAARAVTIAELSNGAPVARPAKPLPAPVTITDPATVRGLAALIDGLPLSTIPPDAPCPFAFGSYLSLTFRARPGGPALAVAETGQPCGTVALTVRGAEQPALQDEPALDSQLLKLAALPGKLS